MTTSIDQNRASGGAQRHIVLAAWRALVAEPQPPIGDYKAQRVHGQRFNILRDTLRAQWMTEHELVPSRSWASWNRQSGFDWLNGRNEFSRLFDHVELFRRPGRWRAGLHEYVFTTQPYRDPANDARDAYAALRTHCVEYLLECSWSWDGWHNPDACPLIVIEPSEPIEERP